MGRIDEIVPDSQDEAEFEVSDAPLNRELSPPYGLLVPTNSSIFSLRTSPSFILPRPKSVEPTTISNYTTNDAVNGFKSGTPNVTITTVPNTTLDRPSDVSSFNSSPISGAPARHRPRPKPDFSDTINDTSIGDMSIASPSAWRKAPVSHPSSYGTFTTDISERIKARRATQRLDSVRHESKIVAKSKARIASGEKKKKKKRLASEIIDIRSGDEHVSLSPTCEQTHPLRLPLPEPSFSFQKHKLDGFGPNDPHRSPKDTQDASSAISHTGTEQNDVAADQAIPLQPPKKRNPKAIVESNVDSQVLIEKQKPREKKSKTRPQKVGKTRPKAQSKDKDKEQFKSSEFVVDSDDELALGNGDGAGINVAGSILPQSLDVTGVASAEMAPRGDRYPATDSASESSLHPFKKLESTSDPQSQVPTKEKPKKISKKRKTDKENDVLMVNSAVIIEDRPPSKKPKHSKRIVETSSVQGTSKDLPDVSNVTDTTSTKQIHGVTDEEDTTRPKKKIRAKEVVEDEEDQNTVTQTPIPFPAPTGFIIPARPTIAPHKISLAKKAYYLHPPKNRSLSAILQQVNGASNRPRSSPAVSRSFLTRIAPLHPNRRTPPPPPPPRIIPKKTKKELEREEKWEEELQETVEGWCELEEAERERMRRAKRDWELGFCED